MLPTPDDDTLVFLADEVPEAEAAQPWDILVVDDEAAVHAVTTMVLGQLRWRSRPLRLTPASNAQEARDLLSQREYAVLLLDVVMETEDAGLGLVRHLRDQLHNRRTRIIIRTGQPGIAPPERVVRDYDINDYREKASLTARDLTSAVITALREYEHLCQLDETRLELAEERAVLAAVLDSMPAILFTLNEWGAIQHWNTGAQTATGLSAAQVKGCPLDDVAEKLGLDDALQDALLHATEIVSLPRRPLVHDDVTRFRSILIYPTSSPAGRLVACRIEDVTTRVHMEALSMQAEKMLSLGGLAAGMAHEINNPLEVILQGSNTVRRRLAPDVPANMRAAEEHGIDFEALAAYMEDRKIPRFIDGVIDAATRAAAIVRNMLSFARQSGDHRSFCNINEVLDRALALVDQHYDLKKSYDFRSMQIIRNYADALPPVECIGSEIEQVVFNLLQNAAHALHGTPPIQGPRIEIASRRTGDNVEVTVADNGPGMSEANAMRVFEPFFTTKPPGEGTGLGLSVSYYIITEHHGGTFRVLTKKGEGARFIFTLPLRCFEGRIGALQCNADGLLDDIARKQDATSGHEPNSGS